MPLRNRTPVVLTSSSSSFMESTGLSVDRGVVIQDQENQALRLNEGDSAQPNVDSQRPEPEEPIYYMFSSFWSSFSFIFAIVFSQHVMFWNLAFASASIGPFLLAFLVTGFAVANYVFCMVELCELYPFAGGNYAFTRVTFGRFPAFIVGCLDVFQYAFMTFIKIARAASILRDILNVPPFAAPLFMLAIYPIIGGALALTWRGKALPTVFMGFAVSLALLYLLFVFSTIPEMDSEKWLHNYDKEDAPSFEMQFLSCLDNTLLLSHGIGATFLLCDKTKEPTVTIPRAVVRLSSTLCVWLPVLVVCVASQYPGVTLNPLIYWNAASQHVENFPLEPGFSAAFHISDNHASLFTFFPNLICAFCYMWASALQIQAMAEARLMFPGLVIQREGESDWPTRALIASIIRGFLWIIPLVIAWALGASEANVLRTVVDIEIMSTLLVYLSVVVSYVYFRTWGNGAIAETYKNPFGRAGAVCAALIFLFVFAAMPYRVSIPTVAIHQGVIFDAVAIAYIALYLSLMSIYYFRVAMAAQTITDAESGVYLSLYAIRANRERDEKIRQAAKKRYLDRSYVKLTDCLIPSTGDDGSTQKNSFFVTAAATIINTTTSTTTTSPSRSEISDDYSQERTSISTTDLSRNDVLEDSFKVVERLKPSPRPAIPDIRRNISSSTKVAVDRLLRAGRSDDVFLVVEDI